MMNKVYIIGAGPGDPDLITVKGRNILQQSDVIIYAGSLVNKQIIEASQTEAKLYNSASLNLREIIQIIEEHYKKGLLVSRLHTGDPTIYGAIREQMAALNQRGIPVEVIPGVSSFTAAAAALQREFTLPDISQTVICTRMEGRTGVPELESISRLASHQASMAIFLSVQMIDTLTERLLEHYDKETPAAVVYKATWPEQKIVRGTVSSIASQIKKAGINKTAMVLVGDFLGDDYTLSKLYDPLFSHEFRKA
jgi:precorrin-4/cobalt-precorrin-4 C11-methyltransferase